ncbi:hypothetical protein HOLleu_18951 [Holothuria leucospilota]|nr:hypothetical protein HOLleu_18951 [Holothuria leucospilota]
MFYQDHSASKCSGANRIKLANILEIYSNRANKSENFCNVFPLIIYFTKIITI